MGRGDRRSKKGKIFAKSYGKSRPKKGISTGKHEAAKK
jgi:ribosomal small subunit protein bTHX